MQSQPSVARPRGWAAEPAAAVNRMSSSAPFFSGIEHTCFYSCGWHIENVRYFID
jgi:hypothetical protein